MEKIMKTILKFTMLAGLLSLANGNPLAAFMQLQPGVVTTTDTTCHCPVKRVMTVVHIAKPAAKPAQVTVASPTRRTLLDQLGWPDWMGTLLVGMITLLVVMVAFILGRVTAPVAHHPQVVAPVVYVHPPDYPRVLRP